MSKFFYSAAGCLVSKKPCKLLSIIIVTDGGGPGKVNVFNARGAIEVDKVATLRCPSNSNVQYHWTGLDLEKGLYVEIAEKADFITVEWESLE